MIMYVWWWQNPAGFNYILFNIGQILKSEPEVDKKIQIVLFLKRPINFYTECSVIISELHSFIRKEGTPQVVTQHDVFSNRNKFQEYDKVLWILWAGRLVFVLK